MGVAYFHSPKTNQNFELFRVWWPSLISRNMYATYLTLCAALKLTHECVVLHRYWLIKRMTPVLLNRSAKIRCKHSHVIFPSAAAYIYITNIRRSIVLLGKILQVKFWRPFDLVTSKLLRSFFWTSFPRQVLAYFFECLSRLALLFMIMRARRCGSGNRGHMFMVILLWHRNTCVCVCSGFDLS